MGAKVSDAFGCYVTTPRVALYIDSYKNLSKYFLSVNIWTRGIIFIKLKQGLRETSHYGR